MPTSDDLAEPHEMRVIVADDQRQDLRFAEVGGEHAGALTALFQENSTTDVTGTFDPFPLTAAQAQGIAVEPRRDLYYLATQGDVPLGMSMLRGFDEGYEVPSLGVLVHRESQGRGIGRQLTAWTVEQARLRGCAAVRLTVYADNPAAHSLFSSLEFREVGRELVDRAGEPAEKIVMHLVLGDSSHG